MIFRRIISPELSDEPSEFKEGSNVEPPTPGAIEDSFWRILRELCYEDGAAVQPSDLRTERVIQLQYATDTWCRYCPSGELQFDAIKDIDKDENGF